MVLSILCLENKHKIVLHLSILYEYQQYFQHRICFSIQPPDYSDPWPTLARSSSFFLIVLFIYKNIIFYCIYQYFMSINSFFNTVSVSRYSQRQLQLLNLHRNRRYFVIKLHTWFCLSYFLKTSIKLYSIYQYVWRLKIWFNPPFL